MITPTDIDAVIDFGGKLFVFIEAKLTGAALPRGQELALERLTDGYEETGRNALCIVCEHSNREGEINLARCNVTRYRWHGTWRNPAGLLTTRKAIDLILFQCGLTQYLERDTQ